MFKSIFIISICVFFNFQLAYTQNGTEILLGTWGMDKNNMPYFSYTGDLPFKAQTKNGAKVKTSNDPYFLLGNYKFKLFAHVSGEYEIFSTERVISRLNRKTNASASIMVDGIKHRLTGLNSLAADSESTRRTFGAGFAKYQYALPDIVCERTFSVLPSQEINEGVSGFRLSVSIINTSSKEVNVDYSESLRVLYEKITNHPEIYDLSYHSSFDKVRDNLGVAISKVNGDEERELFTDITDPSYMELYPPRLFIKSEFKGNGELILAGDLAKGTFKAKIKPGEEKSFDLIIGYSFSADLSGIEDISDKLMSVTADQHSNLEESISKYWSKKIDGFEHEKDMELRREMIWHNYVLELLASYNEYFDETFIPQGCMYLFSWGIRAAPRDQNQHALAVCYTNPELAKSIIRYILKKSDQNGNIPFMDMGTGRVTSKYYETSDQQLFLFMLLSEYLRITGDYDFLLEEVAYYPKNNGAKNTVLRRIWEYYRYLKEDIGLGPHGLIRLGNSDWNDIVFYRLDAKYNSIFMSNESLMNTTMAASILPKLIEELQKAGKREPFKNQKNFISNLCKSISDYRDKIWNNFLEDHKDRTFAKRMYFDHKPVGEDNMFLEPQGFLMQVEDYGLERKKTLYSEIKKRILDDEKIGARQEEKMELSEYNFGSRENGGIWYSLNGPLIIGLSTWNQDAAWELFHKMTLRNHTLHFPQYWTSYWSSFDSIDSSILSSEGLHTQQQWLSDDTKTSYCAHLHAWLVYSYKYLKHLDTQ
ncbi:GH36-type glycosyl hydrolase domain-containing protein [Flagellimonas sp. 2504JD4-2]